MRLTRMPVPPISFTQPTVRCQENSRGGDGGNGSTKKPLAIAKGFRFATLIEPFGVTTQMVLSCIRRRARNRKPAHSRSCCSNVMHASDADARTDHHSASEEHSRDRSKRCRTAHNRKRAHKRARNRKRAHKRAHKLARNHMPAHSTTVHSRKAHSTDADGVADHQTVHNRGGMTKRTDRNK
jgi:hypothetical protein